MEVVSKFVVPAEERKVKTVSARKLYTALNIKEDFMIWLNGHINRSVFTRNIDFVSCIHYLGRDAVPYLDYKLSLGMATEISKEEGDEHLYSNLCDHVRMATCISSDAVEDYSGLATTEDEIIDAVAASDDLMDIKSFSRLLSSLRGFSIEHTKLLKWLRKEGILCKDNRPTKHYTKFFMSREEISEIMELNHSCSRSVPFIMDKGREMILRRLDSSKDLPDLLDKRLAINKQYLLNRKAGDKRE